MVKRVEEQDIAGCVKVIKESFFALGSITFLNFGEKWK
mgnify:CR=1 FL=1